MWRRPILCCAFLAATAIAALAACSSDPIPMSQSQVTTINIFDFYYSPASTTVPAGTRIEWVNHGPSAHTATSDDGVWDSGTISAPTSPPTGTPPPTNPPPNPYPYAHSMNAAATSFSTTLTTPGVYGFHCSLHPPATNPSFVGTITVTE
jgi:plastocyanin